MDPRKIQLSICWIALMLIYLLGDILRAYEKGQGAAVIDGKPMDANMFVLAALMMTVPILMAIVCVFFNYPVVRWSSIIASLAMFAINVAGVMSYDSTYDRMLIIFSLLLNVFTVYLAFTWTDPLL
ncbi:MAG: DUF6326 family protein [Tissierellia bacterium]|nr:DUF6326 family protein [Tissierellia bacterium]